MPIYSLPVETLQEILNCVPETEDLANARLTCSMLALAAGLSLFRSVTIDRAKWIEHGGGLGGVAPFVHEITVDLGELACTG